jgi:hypothetical protein
MEKQTAVEWLNEQLQEMDSKSFNNLIQIEMGRDNYNHIIQEAKEMEKQQIIDAANLDKRYYKDAEDYYNHTFKSK